MHAMDFYVSTCRCVMQADPTVPESWEELHRLLPCLRQALGCYVCYQILREPMGPGNNVCKHSVCSKCVGGKMKLKPSCSWCKDYWDFVPNALLKVLVLCFKKLCLYIYNSQLGRSICNSSVNGETNSLMMILKEVVESDDSFSPCRVPSEDLGPPRTDVQHSNDCQYDPIPNIVNSVNSKPSCSSDEDVSKNPSLLESDFTVESDVRHTAMSQVASPERRQHFGRTSDRLSSVKEKKLKEMPKPTLSNQKMKTKRPVKTVVFLKRASQNKRNNFLRNKVNYKQNKRRLINTVNTSNYHSLRRHCTNDKPVTLEKIENPEPFSKRIKKELQPPELKPPSFCKCGKSGNFNQLTCLGQRCPCYSMKLPCIGCKCKGCRNPKKGPNNQSNNVNYMSDFWSGCSRSGSAVA